MIIIINRNRIHAYKQKYSIIFIIRQLKYNYIIVTILYNTVILFQK